MNPHLNANRYDAVTQTNHCGDCDEPIYQFVTIKDHLLCDWKHFGLISYPEVLATDELGKTIEGVVAVPARTVLAQIPAQTSIMFCLDCLPEWKVNGCAICGNEVDTSLPYSRCETLERYEDNTARNLRVYIFHHECLPNHFNEVKDYQIKYGRSS